MDTASLVRREPLPESCAPGAAHGMRTERARMQGSHRGRWADPGEATPLEERHEYGVDVGIRE
jgi:hypothetical protein